MKRFLLVSLLLFAALNLFAQQGEQEKNAINIGKADAIITSAEEEFVMHSQTSGEYNVSYSIMVLNPVGRLVIDTDPFRKLTSFSAKITKNGKVIQKIHLSDLKMEALAAGIADDIYIYSYSPSAPAPYLFEYEYTISYKKGFSAFPEFFPIQAEKVALLSGVYTLSVPHGVKINYNSDAAPDVKQGDKADVYTWKSGSFPGCKAESYMPNIFDIVPYVLASPVDFTYAGERNGRQDSWKNMGVWLYNLQKPNLELSAEFKNKLISLTAGCKTQLDKIEVLYKYLKEHTRYVSIQLGIGGYIPFPAQTVATVGFGDCKGLSNFMKAMLAVVGVKSDYFIISTRKKNLIENYYSLGQMNHAMLAIPLTEGDKFKGDTIWMECTNPLYPLGYKHSDVAGHQVVLIKENGGELVRVSPYADSLSRSIQTTRIDVLSDGSAHIKTRKDLYLDYIENYLRFDIYSATDQKKMLSSELKLVPQGLKINSVSNNFAEYRQKGRDFCPLVSIDYEFDTESFAKITGERLFVPVTPFYSSINYQREERQNDIKVESFGTSKDIITIKVPVGYEVESFPKSMQLDFEWASFSSKITYDKEQKCFILESFYTVRPGEFSKEKYKEFAAFAKKVNRYYNGSIVFKKIK